MVAITIVNLLVVFLAFCARYKKIKFLLKVSFFILFMFLAVRYDFGNDYSAYLKVFLKLNPNPVSLFYSAVTLFEPGWIFLNHLFRQFGKNGFFFMIAFLSMFNCVVYYRFINKYIPEKYYWLAVFLYVFNPNFMLIHASAMRQCVAISFFLLSVDYLVNKQALRYYFCVSIAILFHYSAIILIPVYLISIFNYRINKLEAIALFLAYVVFIIINKNFIVDVNKFIFEYFPRYYVYTSQEGGKINSGLGLLFYSLVYALILFNENYQNDEDRILFKISILSYMLMPVSLMIIMLGRLTMYFQPIEIAVIPILFNKIESKMIKIIFITGIICITLMSYLGFFSSDIWEEKYKTYKTIFSLFAY